MLGQGRERGSDLEKEVIERETLQGEERVILGEREKDEMGEGQSGTEASFAKKTKGTGRERGKIMSEGREKKSL